jgi:hypothetical protein
MRRVVTLSLMVVILAGCAVYRAGWRAGSAHFHARYDPLRNANYAGDPS